MVVYEIFPARTIISEDELLLVPYSRYIPKEIRKAGIYPTFLKGYGEVFGAIAQALKIKNGLPNLTHKSILARLDGDFIGARNVQHYFQKGGKIEHALLGVLDMSFIQVYFLIIHESIVSLIFYRVLSETTQGKKYMETTYRHYQNAKMIFRLTLCAIE